MAELARARLARARIVDAHLVEAALADLGDGGGKGQNAVTLPYSVDFSALPNGVLPSGWLGPTWAVSGGQAICTPTLSDEVLLNAGFTAWTGDNPDNWGLDAAEDASNYWTQNPAGQAQCVGVRRLNQSAMATNKFWRLALDCTALAGGTIKWGHGWVPGNTIAAPGSYTYDMYFSHAQFTMQGQAGCDATVDNASVKQITGTMALLTATQADATVRAIVNPLTTSWIGVVARANAQVNPTDYLLAMIQNGGANRLHLYKCVAGVLQAIDTFDPGAAGPTAVELRCNGTTIEMYSDVTLRYSGTIDEATINTNPFHGMFSLNGGNSVDSFFCHSPVVDGADFIGGSNTTGSPGSEYWVNYVLPELAKIATVDVYRNGHGGIGSFDALVRIDELVIDESPEVVFIDYAVNDSADAAHTSRANGWAPAAEALIRQIRTQLPTTRIVFVNLVQDEQFYVPGSNYELSRQKWIDLCDHYDVPYMRFDEWLHGVLGTDTPDMADLLLYSDSVHFTTLGHQTIANMVADRAGEWFPHTSAGWTSDLADYPAIYDDIADWMHDPQIVNGVDLDRAGTGWSIDGTAVQSSTADDTASYTGTFCAVGLYSNNAAGAGVVAFSVDGGAETTFDLASLAGGNQIYSFERGEHTVTFRVVSGTVKVYQMWAI